MQTSYERPLLKTLRNTLFDVNMGEVGFAERDAWNVGERQGHPGLMWLRGSPYPISRYRRR